jgi:VIT1/CCC1 family predicted Fe2+/Mn2+ transporter
MALSDREKRLLEEMEAALASDDPSLESRLSGNTLTPTKPRLLLGFASILAGVVILFTGLISQITPLGVAGFIVALVGVILVLRSLSSLASRASRGAPRQKSARTSLSQRLEERWNRREFDQQ